MEKRFSFKRRFSEGGVSGLVLIAFFVATFFLSLIPSAIQSGSYMILSVLGLAVTFSGIATWISIENRLQDVVIDESGIATYSGKKLRQRLLWTAVRSFIFGPAIGGRASFFYGGIATVNYRLVAESDTGRLSEIVFDNSIEGVEELLVLIDKYVKDNGIKVFERKAFSVVVVSEIPMS